MPETNNNSRIIAELFEAHADYLYNYAITRVNDDALASDLVQDTFLSALRNYDSFQQKSKASTWLIAILKNKIIDHYRKKVREYKRESLEDLSFSDFFTEKGHWKKDQLPKPWQLDADERLNRNEFYSILQNCLKKLKELQRMAFVLKHLEDMDTKEICKELQITASNYWVIIHRAKLHLRKCIETHWINA